MLRQSSPPSAAAELRQEGLFVLRAVMATSRAVEGAKTKGEGRKITPGGFCHLVHLSYVSRWNTKSKTRDVELYPDVRCKHEVHRLRHQAKKAMG